MPDPNPLAEVLAAAFALAAAVRLLAGWPWRAPRPGLASAGGAVGVAAGLLLGAWLVGSWPRWPPREDQDRLLAVVLPWAVGVELLAAAARPPGVLAWAARAAVAAGAAPILLCGSSYLNDLTGTGTREWPPAVAAAVLGGWAAALYAAWALFILLARRSPGPAPPLALAVTCAGGAATVMLSGYFTGGRLGLPLAAGVADVAAASAWPRGSRPAEGALGVGLVGLYGLLVVGRCFGELSEAHAAWLLAAPLSGWLVEGPYVQRLPRWLRGLAHVVLAAAVTAAVTGDAYRQFVENSAARPGASAPTTPDGL
jgi:hypothetical protein